MYKNLRYKFLTILAVIALAVFFCWPPSTKIHLGLDLKGGVHLLMKVQTDDAVNLETGIALEQLKAALKTGNVTVSGGHQVDASHFMIEGVAPASDSQFRQIADTQVAAAFDRDSVNGTYTFTMKPNVLVSTKAEAVTQAIQTIDRRINELGVSEPVVQEYGNRGDEIVVELPGVSDVARDKEIIKDTA